MAPPADSAASVDARGFCDAILPAIVAELGPACARVEAVVQLYVTNDREDIARVVTLDATPSVVEGESADADLTLAIAESALTSLMTGALTREAMADALAHGLVDADGDLDVLARIAALFDGGASPLSTRLGLMMRSSSTGARK